METENVYGVELLAATGPIHGIGSPPGGDFITGDDLDDMVASYAALRDEVKAPVKLGHNLAQGPLSEFLAGDGAPAAGYVENVRRVGDRVLGDLMAVPRTIAQLMRVGAYRARSVEFYRTYTAQKDKKTYRMVLTGLALLGARLPAVGGLADWAKLYGSREAVEVLLSTEADVVVLPCPAEGRALGMVSDAYLDLADPDRAWDREEVEERLRAWAGEETDEAAASRLRSAYLWRDVDDDGTETYRFPIADVVDGELRAIPRGIFDAAAALSGDTDLPAEDVIRIQGILGDYYWRMERTPPWADYQPSTPMVDDDWYRRRDNDQEEGTVDLAKLRAMYGLPDDATEDQVMEAAQSAAALASGVRERAAQFGLAEGADLSAVVEKAKESGVAEGRAAADGDGVRRFTVEEATKLEEDAAAGRQASRTLYERERAAFERSLLDDRVIEPADVEQFREDYDRDPELVRRTYERFVGSPVVREFGTSARPAVEEPTAEDKAGDERAYAALKGGGA